MLFVLAILVTVLPHLNNAGYQLITKLGDISSGYFGLTIKSTGVENADNPDANTYCIIGNLNKNNYKINDKYYVFKLVYTNTDNTISTIKWSQTSWITSTSITGFQLIESDPIETVSGGAKFAGLGLSYRVETYLDGNGNDHNDWWNSVGTILPHNNGIPAFNGKIAKSSFLYIYQSEVQFVGQYQLITQLKNVKDGYFSSNIKSSGLENENDQSRNTYSIIGKLNKDTLKKSGVYRFKLFYTNVDNSCYEIIWTQTSWLTNPTITGFELIYTSITQTVTNGADFKGLGLSNQAQTYLDGDGIGHGNWWNSVGTISPHNNGIPGFNGKIAKSSQLYIYNPNPCD